MNYHIFQYQKILILFLINKEKLKQKRQKNHIIQAKSLNI